MKIVALKSDILGRQFHPYLQAEVRPVSLQRQSSTLEKSATTASTAQRFRQRGRVNRNRLEAARG